MLKATSWLTINSSTVETNV
ncbi:hypothetical protein LINPERPRIM_LOCUS3944 [Linum perenne]